MLLITVHGLANDPADRNWQDEIDEALRISSLHGALTHIAFKYPFVGFPTKSGLKEGGRFQSAYDVWLKMKNKLPVIRRGISSRDRSKAVHSLRTNAILDSAIDFFADTLSRVEKFPGEILIVAHSLGCVVALKALEKRVQDDEDNSKFGLRLLAPPLDENYPFTNLNAKKIWAEYSATDDLWLDLKKLNIFVQKTKPDWAGYAALNGLKNLPSDDCEDRAPFLHSDYVKPGELLFRWLPEASFRHRHILLSDPADFFDTHLAPIARSVTEDYFLGYLLDRSDLDTIIESVREKAIAQMQFSVTGIKRVVSSQLCAYQEGNDIWFNAGIYK